ncbi:MAG: GSCFA domain-containing protein [Magnetovibrionaceae bacterium]
MSPLLFDDEQDWSDPAVQASGLEAAFRDRAERALAAQVLTLAQPRPTTFRAFLVALRAGIAQRLGLDQPFMERSAAGALASLAQFESNAIRTMAAYQPEHHPNPGAVRWPRSPRSQEDDLYTVLPMVENLGLVSKSTAVTSIGSCFASEIAFSLQRRGYNYVVTEGALCEETGARYAADMPEPGLVQSSANWGIVFNTAGFRQLAEKAFGLRELPRLLVRQTDLGVLTDPFRESVLFPSAEAYQRNYPLHAEAVRQAFLQAEVVIITPGLTEVWEYIPDGSILSRSIRAASLAPLIRPRTTDVAENAENLQVFIDILRSHNPSLKVIMTVSPVPLSATFRGRDTHIVAANGLSKATLRAAVEQVVNANRDVYYFPSYELVTMCTKDPWIEDQRHVSRSTVARVLDLFEAMFVVPDDKGA